jgi:hypothetical protein
MSKYQINEDQYDKKTVLLNCIANELAEANRIARAEMDFKIINAIDPAQLSVFDFVNKDLA